MGRSRTVSWVIGGILVALALTGAAWLLAISPRIESAADMQEQAVSEGERVNLLNIQLAGLQRDFANIEEFREQLAELRVEVPSSIELSTVVRQIDELAKQAQVFVVSLNPGTPLVITPPVVAAPVAPTEATEGETDETATDETATDETATDETAGAVPAAEPAVTGLFGVPFEIRILGTFDYTVDFLVRLQTGNPRLILVTSFSTNALEETGAQSGRPAAAAGDLETVITGLVFVQLDVTGLEASADGEIEGDGLMPVPSDKPNPFAPVN